MPHPRAPQRGGGGVSEGMQSLLLALSGWLLKLGLAGTIACLAYIMYLIFGGHLRESTTQVAEAAKYVGTGFAFFGLALAVSVVVRLWDEWAYAFGGSGWRRGGLRAADPDEHAGGRR